MSMPEMNPVDSSSIQAVGYDVDSSDLYIEFSGGRIYVYMSVPASTFEELLSSDSKGSYFNREIKPNYESRLP